MTHLSDRCKQLHQSILFINPGQNKLILPAKNNGNAFQQEAQSQYVVGTYVQEIS
jgi:hypothetical protein